MASFSFPGGKILPKPGVEVPKNEGKMLTPNLSVTNPLMGRHMIQGKEMRGMHIHVEKGGMSNRPSASEMPLFEMGSKNFSGFSGWATPVKAWDAVHDGNSSDEDDGMFKKQFTLGELFSSLEDDENPTMDGGNYKENVDESADVILELDEENLKPLSDGRSWIPPSAPPSAKGKDIPHEPQSKTPSTVEKAYGITMQWLPTVAKLAEKDELSKLAERGVDMLKFRVHFFKPEDQGYVSKPYIEQDEMQSFLVKHGIYEKMVELWPSILEEEHTFWSQVYKMHGSKSGFLPEDYYKAGLNAATKLENGGVLAHLVPDIRTVEEVERAFSDIQADIFVVKIGDDYFIQEIRIALDSDFNVCPGHGRIDPVLPFDTPIVLPACL